ncbi:stage II sporulation protein P [Bacillus pseudomycoides]|uniref:Stage II sporulation protein P n=1 Tax=Bacillus pseudomycoides TaxID=64104 RepID=A0AA91ZTI9_9BACI|nr:MULTISPECIES: stage II sporulation protein P [Bacillus]PEB47978.1 stage II sporulation protein P [Bacillus sp. AFS098217]PED82856.1 stage II sporulation protein P [Bacillus pseudomycoides]PEU09693.1 stage II sporulation protein P [Bacillus sp. AFS019443]PEU18388.1 stage II sporulation protein P [Bacillus sp. AFS014408]PFW62632.1 stage II sporulation protein P [Bacillus sp. AFS075034]
MYKEGDTLKKYATRIRGKKLLLFILSYAFVIVATASIVTSLLHTMKSYYVNQWFGKVSMQGFVRMLENENHYFAFDYFKTNKRESVGNLLFSIATDLKIQDLRTFVGKEVPGMSKYYSNIIVAGEGTDYTNIPNESSVPIEEVTKEREVAKEKVKEADEKNPVQKNKSDVKGESAVFIYHTHSWESFYPLLPGAKSPSSPDVNVSLLGERLKEQLEGQGIPVFHDKTNMGDLLANKKLKWYQAYNASHGYVKEALAQNKKIMFPIDIHRDDRRKDVTTKVINGKSYARLYFIIGMENEGHSNNEKIARAINSYLDENYYGLSRGIFPKYKKDGNGVYNQDLSKNAMLIEVGGVDNTLEELYNTIDVLAEVFSKYYWEAEKVNG